MYRGCVLLVKGPVIEGKPALRGPWGGEVIIPLDEGGGFDEWVGTEVK